MLWYVSHPVSLNIFVLIGLMLYVPVNSYDHVRTVSSPSHTLLLCKLDKPLISNLCETDNNSFESSEGREALMFS